MRAWLVTVVLVTGLLAGQASVALADTELDGTGWWWRAQTGLVTPVPPPPWVPDDGLLVSAAPDGPAAVAALRFHVDGEPLAATLTLDVALDQGSAAGAIDACPAVHRWRPVRAGTWDSRPEAACDANSVAGAASEDGQTWFFDVTGLIQDGALDIVLEPPGGAPFQVAFEAPDESSLEVTTASEPVVFDGGTGEVTPPPAAPPPDTFQPPAPQQAAPFTPDVVLPDAPEAAAPEPPTPPAPGAVSAAPPEVAPVAPAAGAPLSEHAPTLGIALLLAAVGGMYLLGRQQAPTVVGLGRFARPRTGPPPPLR